MSEPLPVLIAINFVSEPLPVPIATDLIPQTSRSVQTRQGIVAAKERGVEWGRAGKDLAVRNRDQSIIFAEGLRTLIVKLMKQSFEKPTWVARRLNQLQVPTPNGGCWHSASVSRLIKRLGPSLKTEILAAKNAKAPAPIVTTHPK